MPQLRIERSAADNVLDHATPAGVEEILIVDIDKQRANAARKRAFDSGMYHTADLICILLLRGPMCRLYHCPALHMSRERSVSGGPIHAPA